MDKLGTREGGPVPVGLRDVHIWRIWLTALDAALASYRGTLSSDERDRAERYGFENLRRSYTLSRGALRILLGYYLGRPPNEIKLICGPKGKPALKDSSRIRFNVSHSGQMALYAFTLDCELGVDVEQLRKLDDTELIATRFFSAAEASELLSLQPGDRHLAFFRCWTRKEAYVKAIGDGLAIPLNRFQVTLLPGVPARFVQIAGDMGTAKDWTLHDLAVAPDYVGALAYQDSPRPVTIQATVRADELPEVLRAQTSACSP
ncbi:MAG TPA: 4'-phosphopantetheinyl transferase superfamily protein [Chthoniobacterales bacterium]|nr:4'-phosphopantetheinyl transferase superfamily protein [Chthoniobacterales bacterium]